MGNLLEQLVTAWAPIQEACRRSSHDSVALATLAQELSAFSDISRINDRDELARGSQQLSRLVEAAADSKTRNPEDTGLVDEIMGFVASHLTDLELSIGEDKPNPGIDAMIELSNEAWSDYLNSETSSWGNGFDIEFSFDTGANEEDQTSGVDIENMLAALSGLTESFDNTVSMPVTEFVNIKQVESNESDLYESSAIDELGAEAAVEPEPVVAQNELPAGASSFPTVEGYDPADDFGAREELRSDAEMRDAYFDDSMRCVESMESAALALDANPGDKESIRAFCRELHTLKGASATVGLSALASHLHKLETSLEEIFVDDANANPEKLFEAIDFVRKEMNSLKTTEVVLSIESSPENEPEVVVAQVTKSADPQLLLQRQRVEMVPNARVITPATKSSGETRSSNCNANENSSIRIRAKQLDRLMDMLAELVVLRNRRENNASEFDLLYGELARCSTRLSMVEEQAGVASNASVVGEVSKDIDAVARGFRTLQKPVANDNAAITRFIRDFRQELMHLRRVPMSGLFGRLQRAARDAAKTENKKVRVQFIGENTGLEQEIQERLYESLLHVVRNSVSHGIQSPADRDAVGKDDTGTITLEASASAQLLVIEVRDDGNGVNYEAVRQRGIEKGLLTSGQQVTNSELANLIFHPGFSTRESASEVSGRGVGMDVVATTLAQMQGRIEVESATGKGTTMRLLIPRRTGIEHVMVFRSHDQLYALPMQSIIAAKKSRKGFDSLHRLDFSRNSNQRSTNVLVFKCSGHGRDAEDSHMAIAVEELLGPEEVVVRSLPPMLRNHPLFSGVTLSGSGEKVLLLESENVPGYCIAESDIDAPVPEEASSEDKLRALVVDDSITARKHISKMLKEHGFVVVEAGDGLEAIETLHRSSFDIVVTDLDMPRLGGLELLADIRNGKYCEAPVIVVSSRDDMGFRRQAIEYGARDYITKPVSKQQFQQRLKQLEII